MNDADADCYAYYCSHNADGCNNHPDYDYYYYYHCYYGYGDCWFGVRYGAICDFVSLSSMGDGDYDDEYHHHHHHHHHHHLLDASVVMVSFQNHRRYNGFYLDVPLVVVRLVVIRLVP